MKDNNKNPKTCQTVVFSVYVLWCQYTNKFYVGVTRQKRVYTRIRQHKKGKQFVDKEIKRVGWEGNWDWWIVEEQISAEQISEREQYWVKLFDCLYPKGYNKTCGGISNLTVSDDTREKIRQRALARDISGERNPHYGKHHTDEAKTAIATKLSGENSPRYGKPPANKGVPHTLETRAKMSASHMGEKHPMYGKHHKAETIAKMREKANARHAAKRAAKAVAEENLAVAHSTPTNLSTLLDAVILQ